MGKRKYTRSISWQFALVFASLMIGTIVLFLVLNSSFLADFYIKNKQAELKQAYERIIRAADNSTIESESFDDELDLSTVRYNIDVIVVDVDSETITYKAKDPEAMKMAIWDKIFSIENSSDRVIEQTEDYQLLFTEDRLSHIAYIEIWGILSNDSVCLMRSAIQPMQESARITNLFLMFVGFWVLILGILIVYGVSRLVAKPILKLADISEQVGELNFEAKYTGKQKNEIGLLGANINKMSQTLETTISELKVANVELQRDIEKKEKIEEMRSEFLSNVSHELKTPIAIIQGYAEGLIEGVTDDKESIDYYCSVICDEAKKMNNMVRNLLTLNELEFGYENVNLERFDIVTLIKNRLQATELLAKQEDITITFSCDEPIYVWGDEFKVEEVFTNYLSNAFNHCIGEKAIEVSVEEDEAKVRVSVFNSGEPIPEDSIEHIFEKFYKVDKARTRDYGGSGIGLSIVKAIQESINQKYGVTNLDNGVTFWFELDHA